MTMITAETHPHTFKAFQLIDYDNGSINRITCPRGAPKSYDVPAPHDLQLKVVEGFLGSLTADAMDDVCCGCQDDVAELYKDDSFYEVVDAFLNAYFEDWIA